MRQIEFDTELQGEPLLTLPQEVAAQLPKSGHAKVILRFSESKPEESEDQESSDTPMNDLLHPINPEVYTADMVDPSSRKGDIWWLFHWELMNKALSVSLAAETLSEAVGNVFHQRPDDELAKLRSILEEKRIERNLQEFEEHFRKMEELLKTVREMQERIF
jgi:hypothetical protein